jgi:hypothetical protein
MYVIVCAYVRIIRSIQMCGEALAQRVDWARLFQQRHDGCTMFNIFVVFNHSGVDSTNYISPIGSPLYIVIL